MATLDTTLLHQETHLILALSQKEDFLKTSEYYDLLMSVVTSHNHLYHIDNNPIISDSEYDMLFALLKKLESLFPNIVRDESPTQQLIEQYDIQTEFLKSNHEIPILSLQNTYNTEDILERHKSISTMLKKLIDGMDDTEKKQRLELQMHQLLFTIEPKYDGLSIVLTYENGKLSKAVTR